MFVFTFQKWINIDVLFVVNVVKAFRQDFCNNTWTPTDQRILNVQPALSALGQKTWIDT